MVVPVCFCLVRPSSYYEGRRYQTDADGLSITRADLPLILADVLAQNLYVGEGIERTGNAEKDKENKFKAYKLYHRIISAEGPVDISAEESILIKQVCAATLTAGAYGQVVDLLEGKS